MLKCMDYEVARNKVREAFKKKAEAMRPCNIEVWWDAVEELGVKNSKSVGGWDRVGFMRVTDPVGVRFPSESCTRYGVLYVPEELVDKILVLGLP